MPVKYTMVFQLTTNPTNLNRAIPHTGGWSESIWASVRTTQVNDAFDRLLAARRTILPAVASIVGFRTQDYNIVGNKLLPTGSGAGSLNNPGNSRYATDLPQVSVDLKLTSAGQPNTSRYVVRGVPDSVMVNGEYQPDSAFAGLMTRFQQQLENGIWLWYGRDKLAASEQVIKINGSIITLNAPIVGAGVGTFLRLVRVYADNGLPVKGVFRVDIAPVGAAYTVEPSPAATLSKPSGLARIDAIRAFVISNSEVSRARVKKIGRPSQGYRGRRSKQRV